MPIFGSPIPNPFGSNGVPADQLQQFHDEIEAIQMAIMTQTSVLPARIVEAQKGVLDVYKNAGQPSRPSSAEMPGLGPSASSSIAKAPENLQAILAKALYNPSHAKRGGQLPAAAPQQDWGLQQMQGNADMTGTGPSNSASTGGSGTVGGGAQQVAGWLNNVADSNKVLPLPHMTGAQLTPADQLGFMSSLFANVANRRRAKTQQQLVDLADAGGAWMANPTDPNADPILTKEAQKLNTTLTTGKMGGGAWGSISSALATGATGYTQGKYLMGSLKSVFDPINGMRALGYETGAQGGSPGFLGIRSPFDSASMQGFGQTLGRWGFALGNNLTPGQASAIYNNLYSQGWYGGQATNEMRNAGASIMQANPLIGSDPQTYAMMDQATRLGATSLDQFVQIMKSVPAAAQSAHVSIAQMMSDMQAMGSYNQSIGGTFGGGMQKAQTWANVTGLDPGVMQQMMQNPLVQGMTFMQSGLMPWEQGLASGGQQIQGIMSAVNMMSNVIHPPNTLRSEIGNTGFYNTVSQNQQKSALAAQLLGISPAQYDNLMHNRHGIEVGATISNESLAYQQQVRHLVQHNASGAELSHVLNGTGRGTWGQLRSDLGQARDSSGHRIFSAADIKALNAIGTTEKKGHWETINTGRAAGLSGISRRWVPPGGSGRSLTQIAQTRRNMIQKFIHEDTAKYGGTSGAGGNGPQVTVELGPAAKKFFHLNDPNARQKANVNAGTASVNVNSWMTGPTYGPTPGISTAAAGGVPSQVLPGSFGSNLSGTGL